MKKKNIAPVKGIPESICLDEIIDWVKSRVSSKRFKHIKGVVKQGELLAFHHQTDSWPVVLACWLHDSCKEIKAKELINMATEFKIPLLPADKLNGHILHGPVAAMVAKQKFSITNEDVLKAIAEHTLGGIDMCEVSKIVYLADILEESRPAAVTEPIWQALAGGQLPSTSKKRVVLDLNKAIFVASNLVLSHLVEKEKTIHPKTVEVRNHFLELVSDK